MLAKVHQIDMRDLKAQEDQEILITLPGGTTVSVFLRRKENGPFGPRVIVQTAYNGQSMCSTVVED